MPSRAKERALTDQLWQRVASLLPPHPARPKGGRPPADDRLCFEGIVYVLRNGIRWNDMPKQFPSGPTCWRRHVAWTAAGIWERVWGLVLAELDTAGGVDTSEVFVDATFVPAQKGATRSAKPRLARG